MDTTKDLETMLGDPKKAIRAMMIPLIASYLVIQINIFADTAWCSGLGSDASSAVSSIFPVYWIVAGLGTGLGVGASTSIARHLGRDDKPKADSLATQTIMLSILMAVIITPVMILLMNPLINWMDLGEIGHLCSDYINPMMYLAVFLILNGAVAGILRSEGAATKSMIVLLSCAAMNMILDPLMIYGLNMGLLGAGYATAISTAISTIIGLYWYIGKKMYIEITLKGFRFKKSEMKDVLYVGLPRVTESTIINVMSLIQRFFIVPVAGIIGIAFYNIPWRFVAIAMVMSQAIGSALIPVCSAALGQNDAKKAEVGYRYSFKVSMIAMTVFAAIVFVFAEYMVIPFTYSPSMVELRPEFIHAVRIYALMIPFVCMLDIGSSILQSLRMAQMSMVLAFLRNGFIVVLFLFADSMEWIYWSLFLAEFLGGLMMMGLAYYEFGKYKRNRLLITPS